MAYKLVLDGAAMADLLRSPSGPVGLHLMERSTVVQFAAKEKAGRKKGCLSDSIVKRWEASDDPIVLMRVRIVADTTPCSENRESYALFVEEDTPPHEIAAKNASTLAFDWPAGPTGGMFFGVSVHHPGTTGKHYLKDSLPLAGA
jgi:hypothetical protein